MCTNIELAGSPIYGAGTAAAQIPGFHPADLSAAYKLPSTTAGAGQIIAIVVSNSAPSAESDLAVYRSTFGLPACTTASGCLQIIAAQNNPKPDAGWSREAATDLDMASAVCPKCKLILSEAKSTSDKDLSNAVTAAVALGATVVSNSFTIPEGPGESNAMWNHPKVVMVAAAGDQGYGFANWPAASTNVVAVGATTLTAAPSSARGWTESAWSGTTSGCSLQSLKPVWQTDFACLFRTVADVAVVGDPNTPVAIYDSYQDNGWLEVGGTSVSTPIVAGIFALAGNGANLTGASSIYAHKSALFAIAPSQNGTCPVAYLCNAGSAYSGPVGLGSPNGIAAF